MILLQLSSGQGPIESCQAVGLALNKLRQQCREHHVELEVLESVPAAEAGCFKSLLVQLSANDVTEAKALADSWQGSMLWICPSQFRPKHKRKNWFFGGQVFEFDDIAFDSEISYQSCKASGAGGQHVNTTNSAIRAVHRSTGITVRVESERSQHANKRLAKALLLHKLTLEKSYQMSMQDKARWQQHWQLERGNPVRTFRGMAMQE